MADDTRRRNGPWTITRALTAYDNPWIAIDHCDVIHPDETPGIYGVVRFKNIAIGVLPLFDDGSVLLVGQHRFPLNRYSWELPEGGAPLTEAPMGAAARELAEETGYRAASWHPLAAFDVSNSVTDETAACFLAWDLSDGAPAPEASEDLARQRVPFQELLARCLSGEIRDGLTIVMALSAQAKAERGDLPEPVARRILAAPSPNAR
ncbi:MAG: NUDIX hydrolase [Pseudomonadota bacterium]